MSTLVIRLSSLGDVVLAGAVTGALAPVTFVTRRAWAEVAAALPGVQSVAIYGEKLSLPRLSRVVDLHASPRSRALTATLGAPTRRIARSDLRRRARVWFKVGDPPPSVVQRYADAAGVDVAPPPWIHLPRAAEPELLCLIPGAAHATKQWAPARFVELGRRWAGPVCVLGGPAEAERCYAVARAIGPRVEIVAESGFSRTLEALARCRVAVGGDTGLLHLAAAAGRPVVGLFGPTTSADGFWDPRTRPSGLALEIPLPCRPCSRFGGPVCPVGDHACLAGLSVDAVWAAVERLAAERP